METALHANTLLPIQLSEHKLTFMSLHWRDMRVCIFNVCAFTYDFFVKFIYLDLKLDLD